MSDHTLPGSNPENPSGEQDVPAGSHPPIDETAALDEVSEPAAQHGDGPDPAPSGEADLSSVAGESTDLGTEVEPDATTVLDPVTDDDGALGSFEAETAPETLIDADSEADADVDAGADATTVLEPVADDEAAQTPADETAVLDVDADETMTWPARPEAADEDEKTEKTVPAATKKRSRKAIWWTAGVAAALIAGYVGTAAALADRTPKELTVLGTAVGGMSSEAAVAVVEDVSKAEQTKAIEVTYGEATGTVDPAAAGLALDAEATIAQVTGFTLDPRLIWAKIAGQGGELEPVTRTDEAALETALTELARTLDTQPVDATVAFTPEGTVESTPAQVGYELNVAEAVPVVKDGWLAGDRPVELPATAEQPDLTQSELDTFLSTVAQPLTAGDITVAVGDHRVPLTPAQLVSSATISTDSGDFQLTLDGQVIHDMVMTADPAIGTEPQNARFDWEDGRPIIIPGVDGIGLDGEQVAQAIMAAISADDRIAAAEATIVEPEVTTASLEALGINERIVHFSTPLTSEPRRTQNIRVANGKLTGLIIHPGETFSLLGAIGPITAANGYVSAGTLQQGLHIDGMGGGLSQIATQTFNAGWQAGYIDVAHRPHTVWFPRYPMGSESTVLVGSVDVKWTNDTPYAAMLNAYTSGGRTYIEVWSTPYWSVTTTNSGKYNITGTTTVNKWQNPKCEPSPAGQAGFSVTEKRVKTAPDGTSITDELFWRYQPDHRVICTPPEPPEPEPAPEPAPEPPPAEGEG